jgi:histidine ammonia-lyase
MLENSQDRLKINPKYIKKVYLGEGDIAIEEFVAVARYEAEVCFSQSYEERVKKSRQLVEKILEENRLIYGVNTGFGDNVKHVISPKDADLLQKNIVRSHACSVGEPLGKELVRAIQLMALLDAGSGYSGISLEILELIQIPSLAIANGNALDPLSRSKQGFNNTDGVRYTWGHQCACKRAEHLPVDNDPLFRI